MPFKVLMPGPVKQVAQGSDTACFLLFNGSVYCSGYNTYGALGLGDSTAGQQNYGFVQRTGLTAASSGFINITHIVRIGYSDPGTASYSYSLFCAINSLGTVFCWGYAGDGALGDGSNSYSTSRVPKVPLGLPSTIVDVEGSLWSSPLVAALSSDGTVWTWGATAHAWSVNNYGGLGRDQTPPGLSSFTPGQVQLVYGQPTLLTGVGQIYVGGSSYGYMCAIMSTDRTVWCWGYNLVGQLGIGDVAGTNRNSPTRINQTYVGQSLTLAADVFTATILYMGPADRYTYMCAIRTDLTAWCWGYNVNGNLGTGDLSTRYAPSKVKGAWNANVKEMALKTTNYNDNGSFSCNTCALTYAGTVWCWGYGYYGAVGTGRYIVPATSSYNIPDPQQVWALSTISRIWMRSWTDTSTVYALDNDGVTVWCWGYNGGGLAFCGTGDTYSTVPSPVRVPELRIR